MHKEQTSVMKRCGTFLMSGLDLFAKAFRATYHQIWVSGIILLLVTAVFAIALFFAEHSASSDYSFWDALVWTFVKYVEDPADIVSPPVTVLGQVIGTLVGVLGIAIFAVPAGLIGSGLMEAMDENKREKELDEYYGRVRKAFRRNANKALRIHLNSLPDNGGEDMSKLNFVPQRIPVTRLQIRQGMDMKDIFEVCRKYPDLLLKNLADANGNTADEHFVVEMFPKNRIYGCCIDRGSKVTIVCPRGFSRLGVGWYGYYLSKLGGFNYVCKSIEVDPDELDSYYNLSDEPLYNKVPRSEYTHKDAEALKILDKKEESRKAYFDAIKALADKKDSWVIVFADHQKKEESAFDLHFASALKDGSQSTVKDAAAYEALYETLSTVMADEFDLVCTPQSPRYPLKKKNAAYHLQGEGVEGNIFVLRLSTQLVNFEENKLVVAMRIAQVISRQLDGGKGIERGDVEDFATPAFGFAEKDEA
jgi:voltage-gated potassium channel